MLSFGLYEQVINNALTSELAEIPEARKSVAPIDKAEASKVLTQEHFFFWILPSRSIITINPC